MIVALGWSAQAARNAATAWLADVVPGDELVTSIRPVGAGRAESQSRSPTVPGVARVTPIAIVRPGVPGHCASTPRRSSAPTSWPTGGSPSPRAIGRQPSGRSMRAARRSCRGPPPSGLEVSTSATRCPRRSATGRRSTCGRGHRRTLHARDEAARRSSSAGRTPSERIGVPGADAFAVRFEADAGGSARTALEETARSIALEAVPLSRVEGAVTDALGRVFGLFDALALLAVIVAALGIVNTLTMGVVERVREIGVLRAIGMTRAQASRMVVVEAAVLGLVGWCSGPSSVSQRDSPCSSCPARTGRRPGCRGRRSRSLQSLDWPVRPSPPGIRRAWPLASRSSRRSSSSRQRGSTRARNRPGSSARLRPRDRASRARRERGMTITMPRLDRLPVQERGITIADFLVPIRVSERIGVRVRHLALILAGTLLITLAAQVRFYIPGDPVPVTGQTFGVLLAGGALGFRRGIASTTLYLLFGLVGLPVFAGGRSGLDVVTGVTGGYIVGFILASAIVGRLAELGWDRNVIGSIGAMLLGSIAVYAIGVPWLAIVAGQPAGWAIANGLTPVPRRRRPEARPRRRGVPGSLVGRRPPAGRPLTRAWTRASSARTASPGAWTARRSSSSAPARARSCSRSPTRRSRPAWPSTRTSGRTPGRASRPRSARTSGSSSGRRPRRAPRSAASTRSTARSGAPCRAAAPTTPSTRSSPCGCTRRSSTPASRRPMPGWSPSAGTRGRATYAESLPVGRAFGIPEDQLPADIDAFDAYLAGMLAPGGPVRPGPSRASSRRRSSGRRSAPRSGRWSAGSPASFRRRWRPPSRRRRPGAARRPVLAPLAGDRAPSADRPGRLRAASWAAGAGGLGVARDVVEDLERDPPAVGPPDAAGGRGGSPGGRRRRPGPPSVTGQYSDGKRARSVDRRSAGLASRSASSSCRVPASPNRFASR